MGVGEGLVHRGLAWLFILLAFVGWVLILSGVAALQQSCEAHPEQLLGLVPMSGPFGGRGGVPGYLAPVDCAKIFSYTWWIMAFQGFVLFLLAIGATTIIGTFRGGMVIFSAVLLVLLMDTANTYLYFNKISGLSGAVPDRALVLSAGAIISSIAFFIIIAIIGWHDEDVSVSEKKPYDAEDGKRKPHGQKKGGGLLGGLFGKKGGEEEPVGAGTAGSPRIVHVPQPAAVPAAGSMPRAAVPGPVPTVGPPHATSPTAQGAPVVAYTVAPTVPVSSPAVPVS